MLKEHKVYCHHFLYSIQLSPKEDIYCLLSFFAKPFYLVRVKLRVGMLITFFSRFLANLKSRLFRRKSWGRNIVSHVDPSDYILLQPYLSKYHAKIFILVQLDAYNLIIEGLFLNTNDTFKIASIDRFFLTLAIDILHLLVLIRICNPNLKFLVVRDSHNRQWG